MSIPYLVKNPPRRRQFRSPRRGAASGVIVIHTAESVMDTVGPDTGAESVARFIANRSDPGSYHRLCDSDSTVPLVAFTAEAYGDGTGSNTHAIHISFACRTTDWAKMTPARRAGFLRQGAKAAAEAARWVHSTRRISVPAKRISRAESERRIPGFISHAERDPGRRSDPGKDFPWTQFLTYYTEEINGTERDWLDMTTEKELRSIIRAELADLPADVWGYRNPKVTNRQAYSHLIDVERNAVRLSALGAAVNALAASQGIDPDRVEAAIEKAVEAALADITITLTTEA